MHQLLIYYQAFPPQQKMKPSGQKCHLFLNITLVLTTLIINKWLSSALEKSWWLVNITLAYSCTPYDLSFKDQLPYLEKHWVLCMPWDWVDHNNENKYPILSNTSDTSHSQTIVPCLIYTSPTVSIIINNLTVLAVDKIHF